MMSNTIGAEWEGIKVLRGEWDGSELVNEMVQGEQDGSELMYAGELLPCLTPLIQLSVTEKTWILRKFS